MRLRIDRCFLSLLSMPPLSLDHDHLNRLHGIECAYRNCGWSTAHATSDLPDDLVGCEFAERGRPWNLATPLNEEIYYKIPKINLILRLYDFEVYYLLLYPLPPRCATKVAMK